MQPWNPVKEYITTRHVAGLSQKTSGSFSGVIEGTLGQLAAGGNFSVAVTGRGQVSGTPPWKESTANRTPAQEITNAIEAIQFQDRSISREIQVKYSGVYCGNEEFLTKTFQVIMRLDECNKKIGALREQNSRILGQVRDQKLTAEYNKEEEMGGFDPGLLLNNEMGVLMEETRSVMTLLSGTLRAISKDFVINVRS